MAAKDEAITVVCKDKHSVNLYSASTGNYLRNVYVTIGEIIGQPIVSGNICTITCMEGGRTLLATYTLPDFRLKNKFKP